MQKLVKFLHCSPFWILKSFYLSCLIPKGIHILEKPLKKLLIQYEKVQPPTKFYLLTPKMTWINQERDGAFWLKYVLNEGRNICYLGQRIYLPFQDDRNKSVESYLTWHDLNQYVHLPATQSLIPSVTIQESQNKFSKHGGTMCL